MCRDKIADEVLRETGKVVQTVKRRLELRAGRAAVSVMLAMVSLFSSACGNTFLRGNVHLEAFQPPAVPELPELYPKFDGMGNIRYSDMAKYDTEGRNAFFILPDRREEWGAEVRIEDILQFKLLDHTESGEFIYAYSKRYRGDRKPGAGLVSDGAGELPAEGEAPIPRREKIQADSSAVEPAGDEGGRTVEESLSGEQVLRGESAGKGGEGQEHAESKVTVLMSYHPETRRYKVFSSLIERIGEDRGGETTLIARRLENSAEYMIFHRMIAYVYRADGNLCYSHDYGQVISQEIGRIVLREGGKPDSYSYAVTDVAMDGLGYLYASVTIDLQPAEGGDKDAFSRYDSIRDDEKEDAASSEAKALNVIITAFNINIGGSHPAVQFVSELQNEKQQLALFQSVDNVEFQNHREAEQAAEQTELNRIKAQKVPDEYGIFQTENPEFSLQLAGYTNACDLRLTYPGESEGADRQSTTDILKLVLDTEPVFKRRNDIGAFFREGGGSSREDSYELYHSFYRDFGQAKSLIYSIDREEREVAYSAAKKALALMGKGDTELIQAASPGMTGAGYLYVPPIQPGRWQPELSQNENPLRAADENGAPLTQEWYQRCGYPVPLLFGYKRSVDSAKQYFNRYAEIYTDGMLGVWRSSERKQGMPESFQLLEPKLVPVETREFSRSFSYRGEEAFQPDYSFEGFSTNAEGLFPNMQRTVEQEEDSLSEDELEEDVEDVVTVVTEKVTVPTKYRVQWPENTYFYWVESVKSNEALSPSAAFGAIYYSTEPAGSKIRYYNGSKLILEDQAIPGRAVDAGMLYFGTRLQSREETALSGSSAPVSQATEIIYLLTDEGLKLYRGRQGQEKDREQAKYYPLEELTRRSGYSIQSIRKKEKKPTERVVLSGESLTLISDHELLVSALRDGLSICNMDSGISYRVLPGTYYRCFEQRGQHAAPGKYIAVGYRNEKYTYDQRDIVRAKCYEIDMNNMEQMRNMELAENYLLFLRDGMRERRYKTQIESLRDETSGNVTEKIIPLDQATAPEKQRDEAARILFEGTDEAAQEELQKILNIMGLRHDAAISAQALGRLRLLRKEEAEQARGMKEFLQLTGAYSVIRAEAAMPEHAGYWRTVYGRLDKAGNVRELEQLLVELMLRRSIFEQMHGDRRRRFQEYSLKAPESRKLYAEDSEEALEKSRKKIKEIEGKQEKQALRPGGDGSPAVRESVRELQRSGYYRDILSELAELYAIQSGTKKNSDRSYIDVSDEERALFHKNLNRILLLLNPSAELEKEFHEKDLKEAQKKSVFQEREAERE